MDKGACRTESMTVRLRGALSVAMAIVLSLALLPGCSSPPRAAESAGSASTSTDQSVDPGSTSSGDEETTPAEQTAANPVPTLELADVPDYSGEPSVQVLGNEPQFTDADVARGSFEEYSGLDALSRCGTAFALVGTETMPTEERGSIGMVKPSGWHTVRYDGLVDGNYLYNRCHLIAYQLAGENANERNLITGTRYLNIEGMLPYENEVADYVEATGNHVLYRVTPVFEGEDLVASGVQMEAWSVEDGGEGVSFDVYCYNVQPGVEIDYATGDSSLAADRNETGDASGAVAAEADSPSVPAAASGTEEISLAYVVNSNTGKFHRTDCRTVKRMKASNREDVTCTRQSLIDRGLSPCQVCNP